MKGKEKKQPCKNQGKRTFQAEGLVKALRRK
jgi:hypothetical protein